MHFLLVTVGNPTKFFDCHGLLLYVVLSEKARLARHHLLNRSWNHQIINVVIGTSSPPLFWGNNLKWKSKASENVWLCNGVCKNFPLKQGYNKYFPDKSVHVSNVVITYSQALEDIALVWPFKHEQVDIYFSQACFMCSLGLHISNITIEILELLCSWIKSHDRLRTMVLGNHVWCHPWSQR